MIFVTQILSGTNICHKLIERFTSSRSKIYVTQANYYDCYCLFISGSYVIRRCRAYHL
jgi:hypothetical protein